MVKLKVIIILLFPLFTFSLSYEEIKKAYEQSYLYEKIGDYKNAIRVLIPVYEAYPSGYTVNLRLGWLYYLLGKYKDLKIEYVGLRPGEKLYEELLIDEADLKTKYESILIVNEPKIDFEELKNNIEQLKDNIKILSKIVPDYSGRFNG
jgi:tetratricopeptide (TPR) repeat protein